MSVTIRRFDNPDEKREFSLGAFQVVNMAGMTFVLATYEPGWRWSSHVGGSDDALCPVAHVGLVLSGRAAVKMADGEYVEMRPGISLTSARATTVGSWATNRTSRSTSSERTPTQRNCSSRVERDAIPPCHPELVEGRW